MGAFLVNFHVRADQRDAVAKALRRVPLEEAWIAGPTGGWVTFWDATASTQDTRRIRRIGQEVSGTLGAPLIAFLVHDSDYLCYWLYEGGELRDEYNSYPDYWGQEDVDAEALQADCGLLARYCRPGTRQEELEDVLAQGGALSGFVFAEQRFVKLAPLLGLSEGLLSTDYVDFGRDVWPEELGAVWAGTSEPPALRKRRGDAPLVEQSLPSLSPLLEAAARNDLAAIERLVAAGADINEIPFGQIVNAMGMAAACGSPTTIRRLVELGGDPNRGATAAATPLRSAVASDRPDNVRALVELGAPVDQDFAEVGSLLHVAVMHGALDAARALLELGADPTRKNPVGFTPFATARLSLQGLEKAIAMLPATPSGLQQHLDKARELVRILEEAPSQGKP